MKTKNIFFTTILFLLLVTPIYSTEGIMFLEVKENKADLEKIYEKKISGENIKEAYLHTYTDQKHQFKNISEKLIERINKGEKIITVDIEKNTCLTNCLANEYPYIRVGYIFNTPPIIETISPRENTVLEKKDVFFSWEAIGYGDKLEYMLFLKRNGQEIFKTNWIEENSFVKNLENGKYTWFVQVKDNGVFKNIVKSEEVTFRINEVKEIKKPRIISPTNYWGTNQKNALLIAETDDWVLNRIYLNDIEIYRTLDSRIETLIHFNIEGENRIKVVSQQVGYEDKEDEVKIWTDWTPPSTPDFELKIIEEELFIKIKNNDYFKAHIYLDETFLKEKIKTEEYIYITDEIDIEQNVGVELEDSVGNKSEKIYQMYTPHADVLGIGSGTEGIERFENPKMSTCRYRYNITKHEFTKRECNLSRPVLLSITHTTQEGKLFEKRMVGVYNPYIKIYIDVYECISKYLCVERYLRTSSVTTEPYTMMQIYINNNFVGMNEYKTLGVGAFQSFVHTRMNYTNQKLNARYYLSLGVNFRGLWDDINVYSPPSNTFDIPAPVKLQSIPKVDKFRFPFSKNIGVTQWYGNTAFQTPHTGIDFGSYKEPIYSVGDGYIRTAGWDNYHGECLSGGHFIRIEHDNGMHTVYLHLENYKKENGNNWRVGERIRKGQLLGISGNTGAFNCQPLGYHLHFETRKNQYQSSHTNPVPHIDVNWNRIPTLNHQQIPGRLTGENPHPTW